MLESEADYQRFGIKPEHDTEVVMQTQVAALYAKTMAQVAETLGNPKAAFLAMIDKLQRMPGVTMSIPASYRAAIQRMPESAFVVPTEPLATKLPLSSLLPQTMQASLRKHELDYDAISADSKARQHLAGGADALKALSSLVEENPGDAVLARDVAFSAMELGQDAQAYHLLRRVAELRPYEPQTYRVMAQALADMGKLDLALAYYEIPLLGNWDQRFGDLHAIVELDYLRFLRGAANNQSLDVPDYARNRASELTEKIGVKKADVVVTITWNTDNTDVDLHVVEPSGEECFYGHRSTRSGGELTRDVTQGYGPEMYVLPTAPKGEYRVSAHYFASDRNRASARTKVYVRTFENWGTPNERVTDKVVTLELGKETHAIATLQR
jgi:tetratricopeptide (TPR) repeat protein